MGWKRWITGNLAAGQFSGASEVINRFFPALDPLEPLEGVTGGRAPGRMAASTQTNSMNKIPRKPCGGSPLDTLTNEQQETLTGWLLDEHKSYEEAARLVGEQWGVTTSRESIRRFYVRVAGPRLQAWRAGCTQEWKGVRSDAFDRPTLGRVKELAFAALMEREPDLEAAQAWLKLADEAARTEIARQSLALTARKVALLEQQDERAQPPPCEPLTPEEKERRTKQVFGMV